MAKSSRLHSLNSCSLPVFLWGPAYSKRQSTGPVARKGPVSQKALTQCNRGYQAVSALGFRPAVSLNLLCALVEIAAPLWASAPSPRLHTGQCDWNKEMRC